MAGSNPHQTSPHQAKSTNVRQQDEFLNFECERDRQNYQKGSMHTVHTGGSDFRRKCHVAHEQGDEKAMQQEIDDLKKQLRQAQQKCPLLALMSLPMMKKILYTDNSLELHQANLSLVRKSIFTKRNAGVLLIKE